VLVQREVESRRFSQAMMFRAYPFFIECLNEAEALAGWSVSNCAGLIAERGVERSSYSRSCQVLGAKCTNMPISRSCHAVWLGVGTASLRSGPEVWIACARAGLCQKGRVVLAPIRELIKLRRFIM